MNSQPRENGNSDVRLNVCDTEIYPVRDAFSAFREAVAGAFMPWQAESSSDSDFSARLATFSTGSGSFGRTRIMAVTGIRTKTELSNSPDRLYANYVLSGQLFIDQGDKITTANKGDLVIFDSTLPVKHIKVADGIFQDLSFSLSKEKFGNADQIFGNIAIPHTKILSPLTSCFAFLAENILSACPEELMAIGAACAALLPVAAAYGTEEHRQDVHDVALNRYDREMLRFIDNHIADETLSPSAAAQHLGISVRYVHKRFAAFGTTFSSYVRLKRLELVSQDLVSEAGIKQPIFAVAYRWGFGDLSTFVRAFKKKYGYTPREHRARHGRASSSE